MATLLPLHARESSDRLLDTIGDARYVLLGEASHGTHEFYEWRAEFTKRLIAERGFSFIAVEGDWPDCYRVNRFVKEYNHSGSSARDVLRTFDRWPTWMWVNEEVASFVEWLREHNSSALGERKVGFYGLDVYSLWDSMREVVAYLERVDPEGARMACRAYACFDRFEEDEQAYARATLFVPHSCEDEAVRILSEMQRRSYTDRTSDGDDALFDAEQNALVAANAEKYYRAMVRGGSGSWNVRDRHMVETLDRLVQRHGPQAKAVVWEHNTHVGDARYTDMRRARMVNVGQLVRESHGENPRDREGVAIVGFGTHHGSVIAAEEWGEPMESMAVPPAPRGTWEHMLHTDGRGQDLLVLFDSTDEEKVMGHRAIGVVYDPSTEHFGNWVPSVVSRRYDAFVYFDQSRGLTPLVADAGKTTEMEAFPTGM